MPALSVSVDGRELATVAIDNVTMLCVGLVGQRWEETFATLDMNGGDYAGTDSDPYRTWINRMPMEPSQVVTVSYIADTPSSHAGKTIAELFPDDPRCERNDFTPTAAEFDEMDSRPMLRDCYAFKLTTPQGVEYSGHTEAGEYGFALRVMWTSMSHPECARFSVSTNTVAQLRARTPARQHIKGELFLGQSVRFQVWPITASV